MKTAFQSFQDENAVWHVEHLDNVCLHIALYLLSTQPAQLLETLDPASPAFRKCLDELGRVCGTLEKLPRSYVLEGSLSVPSLCNVTNGHSWDVYEGSLNGSGVCVKRSMIYARTILEGAKVVNPIVFP